MRRGAAGRRAAAGIALALAFLAVAPARGAGAAAPRRFVGLNYAFYPHVPLGAARRMAAGGVRSVRFSLAWFQVERSRGTYDWSTADRTIGDLASQGIDPVPVLFGTPYWASDLTVLPPPLGVPVPTLGLYAGMGTAEPPNATAIGRKAWPRFVGAAVRRYGHGGAYWHGPYQLEHPGAVPRPVRAWQVWNEPNIATYFWPRPSVTRYADLVRISHRAIASNDAKARVVIGGLPCRAKYGCVRYLDDLYAQPGMKRDSDIVDVHPYGPTVSFMIGQLRQARATMVAHRDGGAKLWAGEFGWGSGPPDGHYNKGPGGQARFLARAFARLRRHRRSLGLWRVSWFGWRDAPPGTPLGHCTWCGHTGLLDAANRAKPAWRAFRRAALAP